jgi:hypothetical protein
MRMADVIRSFFKKIRWEIVLSTVKFSPGHSMGCIIFSMDRPIQLDALLRSLCINKKGACEVIVIFNTSTTAQENAYGEVQERHVGNAVFVNEEQFGFRRSVLSSIGSLKAESMFFLVDDIIFTEKVDFFQLAKINTKKNIVSLRLGEHLSFSYVVSKPQPLPNFVCRKKSWLCWGWKDAELDWSYPLSVDGHIFNRREMEILVENLRFSSPNSLEFALQEVKGIFERRRGVCYRKAKLVNVPCNRVQNEVDNIYGSIHQDDLLRIWQEGREINLAPLQGYVNKSVHEEISFEFIERK